VWGAFEIVAVSGLPCLHLADTAFRLLLETILKIEKNEKNEKGKK
jgi:hypothetical protein